MVLIAALALWASIEEAMSQTADPLRQKVHPTSQFKDKSEREVKRDGKGRERERELEREHHFKSLRVPVLTLANPC
jgi:hypothetical protein